jgi:hypothetical protein
MLKFINENKEVIMTEDDNGNLTLLGEITKQEDKDKEDTKTK